MNWKDRVHAAARVLGLPFARAKAFYYREDRRVTAEEMDLARQRIQQHREDRLHASHQEHLAWLYDTISQLHAAGEDVARAAREQAVLRIALVQRIGALDVTDCAGVVAMSAPHRDVAFEAARFGIAYKQTKPTDG